MSPALSQEDNALSNVVLASSLNEGVVHVALDTLVHTLVDLIDESEGSLSELGKGHQVHDGSQGTFLWTDEKLARRWRRL